MLLGTGMGLAVPATGMAVMSCVPAERGIASATMNALRQAGMSLGIALLGSLMGLRGTPVHCDSAGGRAARSGRTGAR